MSLQSPSARTGASSAPNARTAPVVLVTGCSAGGLGFQLCEEFAARGCTVYASARSPAKLEGLRPSIARLALDVSDDASVRAAVDTIVRKEGRIDVLVNNAGAQCVAPLLDLPLADLQRTFDTNVFGTLRVAQAAVPHMQRGRGLVVTIGSVTALAATPWAGAYSASKAALHSLADALDMELRPLGLRCTLFVLGAVRSQIAANGVAPSPPPGSLYTSFYPNVLARLARSQAGSPMPTVEAARRIVAATLRPSPPRYVSFAPTSVLFWVLSCLPRSLVLWLVWTLQPRPERR